jgi:hypothetical protein
MYYDYVIIGMGPCGISTAMSLMNTGLKILIIESESLFGGCWKHQYESDVYFTEHSPKVLFSSGNHEFKKLLNKINVKPIYRNVYMNKIYVILSIIFNVVLGFSFLDYVAFFTLFIRRVFMRQKRSNQTVDEWMHSKHVTQTAMSFINMLCIVINGTRSNQVKMDNFVDFLGHPMHRFGSIVQMESPNEWIEKATAILSSHPNIDIKTDRVTQIVSNENRVLRLLTTTGSVVKGGEFVFCIPLKNMMSIVSSSSNVVQTNWFVSPIEMQAYVDKSTYMGIGIQFHFDKRIDKRRMWCWSCSSEWSIIVIDKTLTIGDLGLDSDIKTVWSCVVCDFNAKNKFGKSINDYEYTYDIKKEVLRQLSGEYGEKLNPKHVSIHSNITKTNYGWVSHESSFTNTVGSLPARGKLINLYSVGPHNMDEIVVIDTALKSANMFVSSLKL